MMLYDVHCACAARSMRPSQKFGLRSSKKYGDLRRIERSEPPKTGGSLRSEGNCLKHCLETCVHLFPSGTHLLNPGWRRTTKQSMVLALDQFIPRITCNNSNCSSRYHFDGDIYQLMQPKVQCSWQQAMVLPQSFQTHKSINPMEFPFKKIQLSLFLL